ncbi:hypothetical protein [Streptomyces sp. SID13031]|uniref:hypothetical protein n=1 Tax=Streptomyces sp. SID13031 TaxID=2706046 RepID=UPI0013CD9115|nr:hypothetical protein [Streptomyces sp. SID13031]NEA34200.1 hypothetical protein [Streptomyces sp. SID13031]
MSKRISGIAGAMAASALLLTGLSTQAASASPATVQACAPGRVCGYNQGNLVYDRLPVNSGQCERTNSSVDYVDNESHLDQRIWSGTNCTGRNTVIRSGGQGGVNLFWSVGGL